jgi:hypothetical protein
MSQRVGGCACVLGGRRAGIQRLYGGLDVCGGGGSRAFGRPARPSTRAIGKGGRGGKDKVIWYGKGLTFAKHSNAKRDAACGSSALRGIRRGFFERVPSMS